MHRIKPGNIFCFKNPLLIHYILSVTKFDLYDEYNDNILIKSIRLNNISDNRKIGMHCEFNLYSFQNDWFVL